MTQNRLSASLPVVASMLLSFLLVSCNSDPIVVTPATEITGQVLDPQGNPVVGVTVNFNQLSAGTAPAQVDTSSTLQGGDFSLVFPRHGTYASDFVIEVPDVEGVTFYGFGVSNSVLVDLVSTVVYNLIATSPAPVSTFSNSQIQQLLNDAQAVINNNFSNDLIQFGYGVTTTQLEKAYENALAANSNYMLEFASMASVNGYDVSASIPFGKINSLPVIEAFSPKAPTGNVTENQNMSFNISALDHDNDFIFYDWSYQKTQANCGQSNEVDTGPVVHVFEGNFNFTFEPDYSFSNWQSPNTTYKVVSTASDGGLFSQQIWCINVANLERPPTFSTVAPVVGTEDVSWSYTPLASSIENAPFNISLVTGSFPTATDGSGGMDMCINTAAVGVTPQVWAWQVAGTPCTTPGLITWTPNNCESTGPQFISIQAADIVGAVGYQSFNVAVGEVNTPPSITSTPPGGSTPVATEAVAWSYQVTAFDPQSATAPPAITGNDPSPYVLPGGRGCPDTLFFSFVQSPPSATIDAHSGIINWTPQDSETGVETFEINVSDGHGGTATQSFTVNAERTELPPTFATPLPGSVYTVDEDQYTSVPFTISFTSKDPNLSDLGSFSLTGMPSDATFTSLNSTQLPNGASSAGNFTWPITDYDVPTGGLVEVMNVTLCDTNKANLPLANPSPTAPITVVTTPHQHYCTTTTVTLNAPKRNIGTVFTSNPATLATGNTQYAYTVSVSDGNVSPPDNFTFLLVGGPGCTVPASMSFSSSSHITTTNPTTAVVAGSATSQATIYWTPNNVSDLGMHCFNIQVADANPWPGAAHTAVQPVQVFVQEQAVTPTLSLSSCATTAQNGTTYSCQAVGATTNTTSPNTTLTYSLTSAPNGMTINPTSGLISWTPSVAQAQQGSASANVIVTNGATPALSAQKTLNLTLTHVNVPPNLVQIVSQIIPTDQPYSLMVIATDPNGYAINFPTPAGLPAGATWTDNGNGTAILDWTPTINETINLTFTASNTAALSASETVSIQSTNGPIFLSHGVLSANVGSNYRYEVHCLDPVGQGLTYTFSEAPNGMTTENTAGVTTVNWEPSAGEAGNQNVILTATDGQGHVANQNFTIYVNVGSNSPPTIVSTSPNYTTQATATELVSSPFTISATDTAGFVLHYAWYWDGVWQYDNGATYTLIPGSTSGGNHTLRTDITDGASLVQVTFNVHVRNAMPVITNTYVVPSSQGALSNFVVLPRAGEMAATTASPNNYLLFNETNYTSGPFAVGKSTLPFSPVRMAIRNDYSTTNFLMGYFAQLGGIGSSGSNQYVTLPSDTLNWSTCASCFPTMFDQNDYVISGGTNEVYQGGTRYNINPSSRNMLSSDTNQVDNPDVNLGAGVSATTLAIDLTDNLIFVADVAHDDIIFYSTTSNTVTQTVSLPSATNPGALYYNATSKKLYVYGTGAGSVIEIIVGTASISYTTTGLPTGPSIGNDPANIITGNDADSLLFIVNSDHNEFVIFDEVYGTYQKTTTNSPSVVGYDPNSINIYFASFPNNEIMNVH